MKKIIFSAIGFALIASLLFISCKKVELQSTSKTPSYNPASERPSIGVELHVLRGTRRTASSTNSDKECVGRHFCIDIKVTAGVEAIIAGGVVSTTENNDVNDFEYNFNLLHSQNNKSIFRVYDEDINSNCKNVIFENNTFIMDHDYIFPEWVNSSFGTSNLTLNAGNYSVTRGNDYYEFEF
jgi:hypothetical protein